MSGSTEISRREFIKTIPRKLASSVHLFTKGLFKISEVREESMTSDTIVDDQIKIAKIDTAFCLAWDGGICQFCYLVCPLRDAAIILDDQRPIINSTNCDGCAKCLTACKTVNTTLAIKMVAVN